MSANLIQGTWRQQQVEHGDCPRQTDCMCLAVSQLTGWEPREEEEGFLMHRVAPQGWPGHPAWAVAALPHAQVVPEGTRRRSVLRAGGPTTRLLSPGFSDPRCFIRETSNLGIRQQRLPRTPLWLQVFSGERSVWVEEAEGRRVCVSQWKPMTILLIAAFTHGWPFV